MDIGAKFWIANGRSGMASVPRDSMLWFNDSSLKDWSYIWQNRAVNGGPIDRYATGMSIYMQPIVRLNTPATVSFVAQLTIAVTAMVRDRAHCTVHFWATTRFGEYLIHFTYRLQWFNYLFRTNCYTLLHKYETFCDENLKLYITMLLWYLIFTKLLTASMCFMYVCMCCCSADWRLAKVMLCTVFQLLPFIYLIFINLLCSAAVAAAAVC